MKTRYLIGLILLIGGFIGYRFYQRMQTPAEMQVPEKPAANVTVQSLTAHNQMTYDTVFPAVVAGVQNTVLQAKSSGVVTSMRAYIGQRVYIGQTLAVIENPGSMIGASDTGVRSVDISQAEIRVRQAKKLFNEAKNIDQKQDTHASNTARENAKLAYESAELELDSLTENRTIKSPVSGIVTAVDVNKNESVNSGQSIITVGIPTSVKITFFVSQNDINAIALGQKVELKNGSNDTSNAPVNTAIVTRISPQADTKTGKFLIEAKPDTSSVFSLTPGTAVTVVHHATETADASSTLIPLEALFVGQNSNAIFILKQGDSRVKKTPVTVLRMKGNIVQISLDGLDAQDRLVIGNAHALSDGEEVVVTSK